MDANQTMRLYMFEDMLERAVGLSCWRYDDRQVMIASTREDSALMDAFFSASGCKQAIYRIFKTNRFPVQVSDHLNLHWLAIPYFQEDTLTNVFLLGPCLLSYTSEQTIISGLRDMKISQALKQPLIQQFSKLPIIPYSTLMSFGIMLYFCLTEQRIVEADIQLHVLKGTSQESADEFTQKQLRQNEYAYEELYFSAIIQGNMDFKAPPHYDPSQIGQLSKNESLRHTKNQMVVMITLASRAAMRGGLPPDIVYPLSDHYILMSEDCSSAAEAYEVGLTCYRDMLQRVHRLKQQTGVSRELQQCCAYIETRLSEKIDYEVMAADLGYNRQYLSAKFKKETGKTLGEFLTERRVEYAKVLLRTTNRSILDISQMLQFSSSSHFGATFRKYAGTSPSSYRNKAMQSEE